MYIQSDKSFNTAIYCHLHGEVLISCVNIVELSKEALLSLKCRNVQPAMIIIVQSYHANKLTVIYPEDLLP